MTLFRLHESEVAALVRAVTWTADGTEQLDRDQVRSRFASAAWACLVEPGDAVAGHLVAALGPGDALDALLEGTDVATLAARLAGSGASAPPVAAIQQALDRWMPRLTSSAITTALAQAARFGARLLVPDDALWPTGLGDLGMHAPLALWVRGQLPTLTALDTSIALVGARAATGYGEHVTMEASAGLVDRGYAIVSGAAYGIDGMAHRAALASRGVTVAFLAGGVDRYYPSGHESLLTRIADTGLVLSEVPCGTPPSKWRFLQRNRLIAAVSNATVVVEAGWRSGSLNTAGHAATLGRPLGAVPGPVTSAASAGCHRLLRDFDAICVTNADEMAALAPHDENALFDPADATARDDAADVTRVLDALAVRAWRTPADVAARAGLSLSATASVLGLLELEGRVSMEDGRVRRASGDRG